MYKNIRFHNEIKKWNTEQLIEVLETNGLGDCCEAIQAKDIDGEAFLKLNEGQLVLWRNILSNVQIKRLWSYIQLANEKPQDFVTNLPNTSENLNTRKTEKIKSPISETLKNILEQQNNPTLLIPQPDGNYPKVVPLYPNNDIQQNFPPKPNALPPKPLIAGRRPVPPPISPTDNLTHDNNFKPPISSNNSYPKPSNIPSNISYPKPPNFPDIPSSTPYPKPPNIPQVPASNISYPKPPYIPSSNIPYPKPPNIPQVPEPYEEEQIYEDEPLVEHDFPRTFLPPSPNTLYKPSNPVPIRRDVPSPNIFGRPLPTPPEDESPLSVQSHLVAARNKSPQPSDNLPRPPFVPPLNIPLFQNNNDDDNEDQVEYDFVEEAQIPEYKQQSWFKDVNRKNASILLQGRPNGTFIARPSKQQEHECTLTLIYEGRIYNLPILKYNGKVNIGKNSFNTVSEIVERFIENPLVLNGPNNEDVLVTLRRL